MLPLMSNFALQGSANPRTPGSKNKKIKSCVLLPAAGRRMQRFILLFSEPGVHGIADPCSIRITELNEVLVCCESLQRMSRAHGAGGKPFTTDKIDLRSQLLRCLQRLPSRPYLNDVYAGRGGGGYTNADVVREVA